jgi:tRNA(fMet)-specific endonuclease VapC
MSGEYLLDTNVVIGLLADESTVKDKIAGAEQVFIPSIVIGELCFGARKSSRVKENLALIDELAASIVVLGCDTEVARRYGEVKGALRVRGRPIPENDIWIAAIALQYGLTLATRDMHFNEVAGLRVAAW